MGSFPTDELSTSKTIPLITLKKALAAKTWQTSLPTGHSAYAAPPMQIARVTLVIRLPSIPPAHWTRGITWCSKNGPRGPLPPHWPPDLFLGIKTRKRLFVRKLTSLLWIKEQGSTDGNPDEIDTLCILGGGNALWGFWYRKGFIWMLFVL